MDDAQSSASPSGEQPKDFNKIDLTQLQGFSFGTQWTQDPAQQRGGGGDRRDDRGPRPPFGPGGDFKRDRRAFRRPEGAPVGPRPDAPPAGGDDRPPRPAGDDRPREFRGGPRREGGYGGGGGAGGGRPPFRGGSRPPIERGPYISPFFNLTFYPEDTAFTALAKTVRASCRTFELFEIARAIIGKNDRFVVVLTRRPPEGAPPAAPVSQLPAEGESSGRGPVPGVKPAPLYLSLPDGVPFESDDAAVAHVLSKHIDKFFDLATVEVEPPKGNFQIVNRCGMTGELLGPPNYHRYNQILQQHHATKLARLPFDRFRERIESVRDPEIINQWLAKMKTATRYTWKLAVEGETAPVFENLEDARLHLLTQARDKVVRPVESARFHAKIVDSIPMSEIRRAIDGALERQRRFPLDTANALRGRLRREGFTIFKKGAKGVSYVCAVKRKFRIPGQVFSDSLNALISFIETHPMVRQSELPERLFGITPPPPAPPAPAPAPAEGEAAAPAAPTAPSLPPEAQHKLQKLQGDLRWLVSEGYVTEFSDGRLFAPPPMAEARRREIESAEHDPENFPEGRPDAAAKPSAPAAEESSAPETPASASEPETESAPSAAEEPTEPSAAVEAPEASESADPASTPAEPDKTAPTP